MHASAGRARVALALAIVLSACATRQSEHYEALRTRLEPAAAARPEAEDPLAGRPELTRAGLVEGVLARNPDVATATEAARAALARFPQETALPDPMFGYAARPRSFGSSEVDPANDFELSQAVPFPGKLALRGERALAEADAAATNVDATRLRLAALASQLFDAYWLAERGLETNAEQRTLLDEAHAVGAGALLRRYRSDRRTRSAPRPSARCWSTARSSSRASARSWSSGSTRSCTGLSSRRSPRRRASSSPFARPTSSTWRRSWRARSSSDRSCRRSPPRCARARRRSRSHAASSSPTSPCAPATRGAGRRIRSSRWSASS